MQNIEHFNHFSNSLEEVLSGIKMLDLSSDSHSDIPSEGELCKGFQV